MSAHSRKPSSRAALPRRTTKGPLDAPDPLTTSLASSASSIARPANVTDLDYAPPDVPVQGQAMESPSEPPESQEKDLSFLLDASIYHPVSQLEVPGPFRKPLPPPISASVAVSEAFSQIENLLSRSDFLAAAYLAGNILTSGRIIPTDTATIFRLLSIRYACLELSGNVLLAAQESKALEDLASTFYFDNLPEAEQGARDDAADQQLPHHIMPFGLRLQALRLQSIGFSDSRRGVSALYDLGLECRETIASPQTSENERQLWIGRLEEVGLRVVNALIELGDLDCASWTLESMKPSEETRVAQWHMRKVMLYLKMGLSGQAKSSIDKARLEQPQKLLLEALVFIADDELDKAIEVLSDSSLDGEQDLLALAKQNLAVAYLYKGEIQKAKSLLDQLVNIHQTFQTLTINLATTYELMSDRSRDSKINLATQIAQQQNMRGCRPFTNADFKL